MDENQEEDDINHEFSEILSSFPRDGGWNFVHLYQYQNFWYPPFPLQGVINFQRLFKASHDDIFLVTMPKSGTTWLKALAFAIMNRGKYNYGEHPLLSNNPHHLVPSVEFQFAKSHETDYPANTVSPRLLATHIPYVSLPSSVKDLDCRVVYLCRNPRDTFISLWKFMNNYWRPESMEPISLEEAFELFCKGICFCGPYWDHVLEYWNESLKRPERVLFLNYEMKANTIAVLKKLADFLGCPFSSEEQGQGEVEKILNLCSFKNLSNLEVNKTGIFRRGKKNCVFFRKGEVGDWANYFTPHMTEMFNEITEQKLQGFGVTFGLD